jgi:dTMP kinase
MRSLFIVFEGLDGAGTTTQLHRLHGSLLRRGLRVDATSEPTSGPIGKVLRDAIEGRIALDPVAQALAFAADRADHAFNPGGIAAALRDGRCVLCDRYVVSGLAYQAALGLDLGWLATINALVPKPDVTIFIDTPVDVCAARIAARGGGADLFHETAFLATVRNRYEDVLATSDMLGTLLRMDGDRPVDDVEAAIAQALAPALRASGLPP